MNAADLLEAQHREFERFFSRIDRARDTQSKAKLVEELADLLAAHAVIERRRRHPAEAQGRPEDLLLESLEEHLGIKRVLADLLRTSAADDTFDAKVEVLKEQIEHHVGGDAVPL